MRTLPVLLTLLGALAGCTRNESVEAPPPYRAITDTRQLMSWIIDPNADVIWGAAGYVVTAEGTQDLAPTTQEGWNAVRDAAAVVAEAGNLLLMPGHARPGQDWTEIAQRLTAAGEALIDAAERQDGEAVFNDGGTLYSVCVSCHQLYLLNPTEEPAAGDQQAHRDG